MLYFLTFIFIAFSFFSCARDTTENMQSLRDTAQSSTAQQRPGSPDSTPMIHEIREKMDEEYIEHKIKSIVDGFLVKGLDRNMQSYIMAESEFEEIHSIEYFPPTQTCEVIFSFFLMPEEFRGQDTIESDGMVFEVSNQHRQGKAVFKYLHGAWELDQMFDQFFQIDFLLEEK